jgi:succinyl-diaminopimelate desuccinylase
MDSVALAQSLVRVDTVNPPGREDQCTAALADALADAGYACRQIAFAPGRATLLARIGGHASRAPLCFTGHLDVVPLGARAWSRDPFGAEIDQGRLYGRGSSDMKSGVAAFVAAAVEHAEAARAGAGVMLVITAGEETGCEGAFHLAAQAADRDWLGPAGALVVAEPTGNAALLGHKGALWLRASVDGVAAHGSTPHLGSNAIYKIARAALVLEGFAFDALPHATMGAPTLNVGTLAGGSNINSVPDLAELTLDIRSVAGQDHATLRRCLCQALGPQVRWQTLVDLEAVCTAADAPWIRRAIDIAARYSAQPSGAAFASYFTDAAVLRPMLGMPPTLVLGPGEPAQAHQTDEYCEVAKVRAAQALYGEWIEDWCGAVE